MRQPDNAPKVRYQSIYLWMQSMVIIFLPAILLFAFVGGRVEVRGNSMLPTFQDGDQTITRSIFYTPRHGDVIVFSRHDVQEGTMLVKRVIALEGDVVDIHPVTGAVFVNYEALDEPYISDHATLPGDITYPFTVPTGYIFVLGDNRSPGGSLDSRSAQLGPVDEREVIGQVVAVVAPLNRLGLFVR